VPVGYILVDQIDRVAYDRAQLRRCIFKIDHLRERIRQGGIAAGVRRPFLLFDVMVISLSKINEPHQLNLGALDHGPMPFSV
jgi:hypothetical protein